MARNEGKAARRPRMVNVPVGLERALYLAAVDPEFRRQLLQDPESAVDARRLPMRPSERAMLVALPADLLRANIDSVDTSGPNLERRSFLRAVAASAAVVAAADGLGCSDDDQKVIADQGIGDRGARPDFQVEAEGGVPDAGIWPDMPGPDKGPQNKDGEPPDTLPVQDMPMKVDAGIWPDMPLPDTMPAPKSDAMGDMGVRPKDLSD